MPIAVVHALSGADDAHQSSGHDAHQQGRSVTRDGVADFSYSGFLYDVGRRLTSLSTLDSGAPFTMSYTDVLRTGTTAPGAPGAGAWKNELMVDAFARPTEMHKHLNGSGKQTHQLGYTSTLTARPTTLTRGLNGSTGSVSSFVYDDFGQLIESVVPETGTARFQYDVAGHLLRERVGVGTPLVRTSERGYDSLGRLLFVDHDLEHPVDCSVAASGTPIQDEEYVYDACPSGDVPPGFACTNGLGHLVSARVVEACEGGAEIRRGDWYAYDAAGRLSSSANAKVTGTAVGVAAVTPYTYSPEGRLLGVGSPLTTLYGTAYTYSAGGQVATVQTSSGSNVVSNLRYRAFGPLRALDTPVTFPVSGGSRTLQMRATHRSDDTLGALQWQAAGTGTTSYLSQAYAYTQAGVLQTRTDSAEPSFSRHYGYDALMRLTCEAREAGGLPSSADCVANSPRLAALHTFNEGASPLSPTDTHASSIHNVPGSQPYVSGGPEYYGYGGGSGKILQVTRSSGGNLMIDHDALGRRLFDYDNADPVRSRRDYTYLPNGQLGSISGRTQANQAYTISIRYDVNGKPSAIRYAGGAGSDSYELFHDESGRLIAVQITLAAPRSGVERIFWDYHYLGDALLAMTRSMMGASPSVKRFWSISDERGLPHRLLDEQGVEFYRASWDASGWRLLALQADEMWIPFGMYGQIILPGSEAYASNGVGSSHRPAIALNQWRAYDPLLGSFLQPDPADRAGRMDPEGYLYARGRLLSSADPSGGASQPLDSIPVPPGWGVSVGDSCDGNGSLAPTEIMKAVNDAISQIDSCQIGYCGQGGGGAAVLKRTWKFALATGRYECGRNDEKRPVVNGDSFMLTNDGNGRPYVRREAGGGAAIAMTTYSRSPTNLRNRVTVLGYAQPDGSCWARTVAHEALHGVLKMLPAWTMNLPPLGGVFEGLLSGAISKSYHPESSRTRLANGEGAEHNIILNGLENCISCK